NMPNDSTQTTSAQAQSAMNGIAPQSKRRKTARKRVKRAPAKQSRHLQPRTAEDVANEQTVEQLALRIWATMAAKDALNAMSALIDGLIQSFSLDDDDEEADENGLDNHKKREKEIFDEAIADALDRYPDFDSINKLPHNADPDIAGDAEQLKDALAKCAIGATKFRESFRARNLSGWCGAILRISSRRTRDTGSTYARMCRDQTSRFTAIEAEPRQRARLPG